MRKCFKRVGICLLTAVFLWSGGLIADRQLLSRELIRLHVVGASDSSQDQARKMLVKDAVVESLTEQMGKMTDVREAKAYLQENLPKIEALANRVLRESGSRDRASVKLQQEAFSTRYYDTFALPAGIYEALRITIGEGDGRNWWCVAFPALCLPATGEGFEEAASCAGFSEELTAALEQKEGYEIRFFFLDMVGRLGNLLRS